jgi:hypothetical protein
MIRVGLNFERERERERVGERVRGRVGVERIKPFEKGGESK